MTRFVTWLAKKIAATVLISVMTIYVTWLTVHTYVDQLLAKYHLETPGQNMQFSDFLANVSSGLNIFRQSSGKAKEQAVETMTNGRDGGGTGAADQSTTANPSEPPVPRGEGAVEVWGQTTTGSGQNLVMSAEDFIKKKEKLSDEDKMKIFTTLAGSLPASELQTLSAMAEDGITGEEMGKIQSMIDKYIKPEQVKELTAILNKYN
ncbi:hypothetical protein MJA45_28455 [Paenibacillus aurantius]|uniref:Spore coat protein n=1 Tax=Paenibacillus aurantius TaxID=2918900 RepID=A0AA96LG54_9BACL|nr:hypothetical protein [Paenibacillus aurantius]WNQ11480.1 hypothetical protein MJA45_28455 [Paenibacillus aurantius]